MKVAKKVNTRGGVGFIRSVEESTKKAKTAVNTKNVVMGIRKTKKAFRKIEKKVGVAVASNQFVREVSHEIGLDTFWNKVTNYLKHFFMSPVYLYQIRDELRRHVKSSDFNTKK